LTIDQLFDTFYIPIANTYPQKYKTQYDTLVDQRIQKILDKYLATDRRIIFVVIVDSNGYLPTHNSRYSRPLTGDKEIDSANNRAKRLFNDRTGLAAARNIEPFLLQQYNRDTGEAMYDLSIPISIKGKHWGAVRIGYEK
jgi:methyl-accepting chemotaxis protein